MSPRQAVGSSLRHEKLMYSVLRVFEHMCQLAIAEGFSDFSLTLICHWGDADEIESSGALNMSI